MEAASDTTYTERQAFKMGLGAGRDSGSWVLDGNSTQADAQAILDGIETGDPEVMDLMPSPLSGEWADDPTPHTLAADLGLEAEDGETDAALSEACDAYEAGFSQGFWEVVERTAKVYAS